MCIRDSRRGERRAVDGIDGDVNERGTSVTNSLTVIEHWCFVLFTFANDDDAVHRNCSEHKAHGVHCRTIRRVLVTSTRPASRRYRGGLGDPDHLESDVAVGPRWWLSLIHI